MTAPLRHVNAFDVVATQRGEDVLASARHVRHQAIHRRRHVCNGQIDRPRLTREINACRLRHRLNRKSTEPLEGDDIEQSKGL